MGWIDKGKPRHYCLKPGIFERWRNKVKVGAVWQCDECGQMWYWTQDDWDLCWSTVAPSKGAAEPIFDKDGNPNPPPPPFPA